MKKLLTLTLSILLFISTVVILPVTAYAAPVNEQLGDYFKEIYFDENDVLHKNVYDENGEEVEIDDEMLFTCSDTGMEIPASFDSREAGNVTGVRDQNPLGSCWAFAFTAAAESSLVAQDYADNSLDLSEAHLAWFRANNSVKYSTIPVQQDKLCWVTDTFNSGGTDFDAVATAARWSGFALESDYPYVNSANTSAMHFNSSEMFTNNYNLVSARRLTKNNMDEVKRAIMQYGAVSSSMYYSADAVNYSANGCNHYQKKTSGVNHGVTIVGWDDNYSASNFKISPLTDGAWLVKNSWGTEANDDGYFWLSYKDKSSGEFMEVVAKPAGDYDNNYQYDGVYSTAAITYSRTAYAANVFTANGYETIKGAGFYTFNTAAYTCTVSVYTNLTNASNPTSGKLRGSKNISCLKEGYYTVDFDGEYNVAPGEKFAIVVKYNNSASSAFIPYENLTNLDYEYAVEPGQSFYSGMLGNWTDVTTTTNRGNIPIKAFTKDSDEIRLTGISITSMPKTVYELDEEPDFNGLEVTASYSDGSTGVISKEGLFITGFDSNSDENGTINIGFRGFSTSYDYSIRETDPAAIEINTLPAKTEYYAGDEFDPTGLSLDVTYENGLVRTVTKGFKVDVDMNRIGVQDATVSYKTASTTFEITIDAVEIISCRLIAVPAKFRYAAGETELETDGIELLVKYNNGTKETVTEGFEVTGFNPARVGENVITVSYKGFTDTFTVEVLPPEIVSCELVSVPDKNRYAANETELVTDGIELLVRYNNGTKETVTEGFEVTGFNPARVGENVITVSYKGFTDTFTVEVLPPEIVSCEIVSVPEKNDYTTLDTELETDGIELLVRYNNGTEETVTEGFEVTGFNPAQVGENVITVSYGGFTDVFTVRIREASVVSLEIKALPKTEYLEDEELSTAGLVLSAVYENGTAVEITEGYTVSAVELMAGEHTVTVSYMGVSAEYTVNVAKIAVPAAIEIAALPKTEYYEGDEFTSEGLILNLIYSDGSKEIIKNGFTTANTDLGESGKKNIEVEYKGLTTTFKINVTELKAVSISIAALPKTKYCTGETFTASGLVLAVEYNNGTVKNITNGFSVYKVDTKLAGTKTVKVKYERLEASYTVNVSAATAVSIAVVTMPKKTMYDFNEKNLDTSGLTIRVKYSNGTTEDVSKGFTCTGFDSSKSGKNTITVNYKGLTTTFRVTIKEAPKPVNRNLDSVNWVWNIWYWCWSWYPITWWFR